jgi:thiol-disulfide isomerase/thioredoxin
LRIGALLPTFHGMKRIVTLCSLLGLLSSVAFSAPAKGPEPLRIAQGETVQLADYLVPGKTVIFDFTSKYCPPCRFYDEPLHKLHTGRADIVVVKVDINRPGVTRIDWDSPVAQQFGLQSIPQFKVYGPDGKLLAEDRISREGRDPAARKLVDGWIAQLK